MKELLKKNMGWLMHSYFFFFNFETDFIPFEEWLEMGLMQESIFQVYLKMSEDIFS